MEDSSYICFVHYKFSHRSHLIVFHGAIMSLNFHVVSIVRTDAGQEDNDTFVLSSYHLFIVYQAYTTHVT